MDYKSTLDYYDTHSDDFYKTTVKVDLTGTQKLFLSKLKDGARILDFGCGSGRDAKYFLDRDIRSMPQTVLLKCAGWQRNIRELM